MDYAQILKRAWNIVWNHKFLWVLGFLVALGSGGGSGGGNNSGWRENFNPDTLGDPNSPAMQEMERAAAHLEQFWATYAAIFIGLLCVLMIVGLVLWLVKLAAEAGLIDSVNKIEEGQKASFAQAMSGGAAVLLRLIGVRILLALPFILVTAVILIAGVVMFGGSIAAMASESSPGMGAFFGSFMLLLVCLVPLACVMFIFGLVIAGIDLFAIRGLVTHNMGVIQAIQHGWTIFRNNLLEVVIVVVILWLVGLLFGLAVGVVLIPFSLIFAAPTIISVLADGNLSFGAATTTGAGFLCLGLVGALLNSIWVAYKSTTITLAYRYFDHGKEKLATAFE
jgi:hypothetical protein